MPQFDQYGMGVLVIASVVVLVSFYFLFLKYFQSPVKMVLGVRERLSKSLKKFMRETDLAIQAGAADANFFDEQFEERVKAAKRAELMIKNLTKKTSSEKKAEKKAK